MNEEELSELLAETENLLAWRSKEDEGYIYHLELGHVTLHLIAEEWEELIGLILNTDAK